LAIDCHFNYLIVKRMKQKNLNSNESGSLAGHEKKKNLSRRRFVLSGGLAATAIAAIPGQAQAAYSTDASDAESKRSNEQEKPVDGVYNVRNFGAKGDGTTLDSPAINAAIEFCSANGGGTVLVPPGSYLSGTIHLKSNMVFHIEAGATILGSKNLSDYQGVEDVERKGRSQWYTALITGDKVNNIEISGNGVVNGNNVFNPDGEEEMRGPHAIFINKSEDITIRDIFVKDAGNYAHLIEGCTNGSLRDVRVSGGWDGVDLFNCKNFLITDCQFTTGDDCVAGGRWENVLVSNCTLNSNCNGMRNYRGGLKDVVFSNILINGPSLFKHRTHDTPSKREDLIYHNSWHGDYDSLSGFWLAGGGLIENLIISNATIRDLRCPVWMSLQGSFSGRSQDAAIRNVQISNLTATGVGKPSVASLIQGSVDRPIENILLTDITIQSISEGTKDMVDNPVPERVGDPVELSNCYGMYCRYIKDLEMHNIRFSTMEKDERPALICEKVDRLEMSSVRGPEDSDQKKSVLLKDIKILRIYQPGRAEK
jgi:hypothetical protein